MNHSLGKSLVLVGICLIVIGLIVLYREKLPSWIGRLPGDFYMKRENFTFYFPLATSIVVSLLLSFLFRMFNK